MKLLLFVCVCALASADQQEAAPTAGQLAVGLTHLYRRFLHVVAPKQLEIQDALEIKWRNGMMSSPPFRSPVKGTFNGVEAPTFSYINSLVTPGQKGFFGQWTKHETSDLVISYNRGGLLKIHMLTDGGIHKEIILGNPVHHKAAKFVALIPKNTYCTFESLSEDAASFVSYISIPAWNPANAHNFSQKEMTTKFPDNLDLFMQLSKPSVQHGDNHDDHDDEHDDHHDHDDDDHVYARRQRRFRGRRLNRRQNRF